jgi:hypothetical protein
MAEETPQEKEALAKLGEVRREVGAEELEKEADREIRGFAPGPLAWLGHIRPFRRIKETRLRSRSKTRTPWTSTGCGMPFAATPRGTRPAAA